MPRPLGDEFIDRLRVLNDQARRIPTAESEILVDFRRVGETFDLSEVASHVVKADALERYQVTGGGDADREIFCGEWVVNV